MRISDLSSDVCSSDLGRSANHAAGGQIGMEPLGVDKVMAVEPSRDGAGNIVLAIVDEQRAAGRDSEAAGREMIDRRIGLHHPLDSRSEESRVGKEGVSTCRSCWARYL